MNTSFFAADFGCSFTTPSGYLAWKEEGVTFLTIFLMGLYSFSKFSIAFMMFLWSSSCSAGVSSSSGLPPSSWLQLSPLSSLLSESDEAFSFNACVSLFSIW